MENTNFPQTPFLTKHTQPPHLQCPTWWGYICDKWWTRYIIIHQSSWFPWGFTFCVVHSSSFDLCIMIHVCAPAHSHSTVCNPTDYNLPGSSAHGIISARILERVDISFSKRLSWPRDQTCISCIGMWILYHWATWKATYNDTYCPLNYHREENSFTALKIPCTPPLHFSLLPNPWQSLILLLSP